MNDVHYYYYYFQILLLLLNSFLSLSFFLTVGYSENSSACLSMLSSHDSWSSLQMPTHSSMIPTTNNSPSGLNSAYAPFLWATYCTACHSSFIKDSISDSKRRQKHSEQSYNPSRYGCSIIFVCSKTILMSTFYGKPILNITPVSFNNLHTTCIYFSVFPCLWMTCAFSLVVNITSHKLKLSLLPM